MFERLKNRIRELRTNLAFRWMPRIADLAVWAASAKQIRKLGQAAPLKLLLDSNIHTHAVTHGERWVDTGTVLWGGVNPIATGYVARIPVYSKQNKSETYRNIRHLTVLTRLAKKGVFSLYTSAELVSERTKHPPSRFATVGYYEHSLLDGLIIETLDGYHLDSFVTGSASAAELSAAQQTRLRSSNDPLFSSILRIFGNQKHSQDAWHLRTAQVHNMYAFLTMDHRLIRMVHVNRARLEKIGFNTRVMSPISLSKELKLGAVDPHLFSYDHASYPVRSDLHLPGETRRTR